MCAQLSQLLVARIIESYQSHGLRVPPQLASGSIYVNTVVDNVRKSQLVIDSQDLARWRATHNSTAGASALGKRKAAAAAGSDAEGSNAEGSNAEGSDAEGSSGVEGGSPDKALVLDA